MHPCRPILRAISSAEPAWSSLPPAPVLRPGSPSQACLLDRPALALLSLYTGSFRKAGARILLLAKHPAESAVGVVWGTGSQSRWTMGTACVPALLSAPQTGQFQKEETTLGRRLLHNKTSADPNQTKTGEREERVQPPPSPCWGIILLLPLLHFSSFPFITLDMCRKTGFGIQTCASCVSPPGNHPLPLDASITSTSKWL